MNRETYERAASLVEEIAVEEHFIAQLTEAIESGVDLNMRLERGHSYYYGINRDVDLFSDSEIKDKLKQLRAEHEDHLVALKKMFADL